MIPFDYAKWALYITADNMMQAQTLTGLTYHLHTMMEEWRDSPEMVKDPTGENCVIISLMAHYAAVKLGVAPRATYMRGGIPRLWADDMRVAQSYISAEKREAPRSPFSPMPMFSL